MLRYLPYLLLFALWIYAFVDCLGTPEYEVRGMPKVVWVLVILFFGTIVLGPLAWLLIGKRRGVRGPAAGVARLQRHREHRLRDRAAFGPAGRTRRHDPQGEALERPEPESWIPPDDNPEFLRALSERIRGGGGQKADGE